MQRGSRASAEIEWRRLLERNFFPTIKGLCATSPRGSLHGPGAAYVIAHDERYCTHVWLIVRRERSRRTHIRSMTNSPRPSGSGDLCTLQMSGAIIPVDRNPLFGGGFLVPQEGVEPSQPKRLFYRQDRVPSGILRQLIQLTEQINCFGVITYCPFMKYEARTILPVCVLEM